MGRERGWAGRGGRPKLGGGDLDMDEMQRLEANSGGAGGAPLGTPSVRTAGVRPGGLTRAGKLRSSVGGWMDGGGARPKREAQAWPIQSLADSRLGSNELWAKNGVSGGGSMGALRGSTAAEAEREGQLPRGPGQARAASY